MDSRTWRSASEDRTADPSTEIPDDGESVSTQPTAPKEIGAIMPIAR